MNQSQQMIDALGSVSEVTVQMKKGDGFWYAINKDDPSKTVMRAGTESSLRKKLIKAGHMIIREKNDDAGKEPQVGEPIMVKAATKFSDPTGSKLTKDIITKVERSRDGKRWLVSTRKFTLLTATWEDGQWIGKRG